MCVITTTPKKKFTHTHTYTHTHTHTPIRKLLLPIFTETSRVYLA